MHYKNIASQDDRQRMMMPEQNNSKVFGIESVVIDGQCFYRLLDQQLNKALNEQFLTLKPIPNQSNYPSPSKRTETDFKPQISYSDPHHQQHPTDPMMHPNQFMEPQHNFHRFEDDLKLRVGFTVYFCLLHFITCLSKNKQMTIGQKAATGNGQKVWA